MSAINNNELIHQGCEKAKAYAEKDKREMIARGYDAERAQKIADRSAYDFKKGYRVGLRDMHNAMIKGLQLYGKVYHIDKGLIDNICQYLKI